MLIFRQCHTHFLLKTVHTNVKLKKKIPIVATNVGMFGLHDIKTAIVNPQIFLTCIFVSDLIFVFYILDASCIIPQ